MAGAKSMPDTRKPARAKGGWPKARCQCPSYNIQQALAGLDERITQAKQRLSQVAVVGRNLRVVVGA